MEARKREHNRRAGKPEDTGLATAEGDDESGSDRRPAQRQQPKRQSRSTRKTGPSAGASGVQDEPKASSNGQQASTPTPAPAKKAPAAKTAPAGGKRQPAAKSRAQRTAQQKAGQKKSGGGTPRKTDS
jgi:YidC/Oxa1 family membrane protein insertase